MTRGTRTGDGVSNVARLDDDEALLGEIRGLLQAARNRAYQAVDTIKVRAYRQVGERIVRAELEHKECADHGARAIDQLARELGLAHDWGGARARRADPVGPVRPHGAGGDPASRGGVGGAGHAPRGCLPERVPF